MKHLTLVLVLFLCLYSVSAQEFKQKVVNAKSDLQKEVPSDTAKKHWLVQGSTSVQFSQASFTNWAAGGQNSLGLVAWINLKANYHNNKHLWSNTLDLGYGFNILGKGNDTKFTKTNDKIEFTTAYGYELSKNKKWFFTVLANFRTQFDNGYNYPDDKTVISKFMAPGYLVAGLGITYTPSNWFMIYLSPASGRFTFVTNQNLADQGAFGVDPAEYSSTDTTLVKHGKNMKGELGPYFRAHLNKDLAKNINLTTTLELFSDYLHQFGNIDINWNLLLSMKVNKWLAASIQTQLLYDNDIMIKTDPNKSPGPRTQFKELLGIGLTYKIN